LGNSFISNNHDKKLIIFIYLTSLLIFFELNLVLCILYKIIKNKFENYNGDWGLGIGDWGLGIGPNPQSPIPNPQSPNEPISFKILLFFKKLIN